MKTAGKAATPRWSMALRTILVTLGSYGLTALIVAFLSLALTRLGMDRVEAITAATLFSFAIFSIIAMAVFHAQSVGRAALWLCTIAAPFGAALLLLLHADGRA